MTQTLDPGPSEAVLYVFKTLFDEGLIYRGERLVNWDPELKTAISNDEVENIEETGKIWTFKYFFADDDSQYLEVATTRPETLFGDQALAVHPDDERYEKFVGKKVRLPFCDREIPILADDLRQKRFWNRCRKNHPSP